MKQIINHGLNLSCFVQKSISSTKQNNTTTQINTLNIINNVLERTFLSEGDKKELKELINEISKKGGEISEEGIVTCYYALSKYNKKSFEKDGTVGAGSDKIMVSTKNTENLKKFGERILTLYIPIEKLYFTASTKEEILLKVPFRSSKRKMNIKQYIKK